MIARKPQKFSLNSGETNSEQLHKERASDFSDKPQQTKFASDTATSILEELGVKKTTSNKTNKNSPLNVQRKSSPIKKPILEQSEWDKSLLKDLKNQKAATKNNKVKQTSANKIEHKETKQSQSKKSKEKLKGGGGFQEKFLIFTMFALMGIAFLSFIGGYLKVFDLAILHQLTSGNMHQLEFIEGFKARKVENGYNRLPLFVVEGSIRNSFFKSNQVKKIQLKALAFDENEQMISSHFTLAGIILSDKELGTLSPENIKSLRHAGDLDTYYSNGEIDVQKKYSMNGDTKDQEVPFQVVFFKDVSSIKRTSLQIVSYVRKNKLVYVRAPDLQ